MKIKLLNPKVTLYYQPTILEDTETLLSQDIEFSYLLKDAHLSKITHLLSYLYMKPLIDKTYKHRFEFIYISAEFLTTMYGKKFYKDILKALIKHDIIEESLQSYKVGERTKSYRLHYKYMGLRFQAAPACKKIAKKQIEYRRQKESTFIYGGSIKNSKKVFVKLERTLRKIVINFQAAKQYNLDRLNHFLQNPDTIEVKKHDYWKNGKYNPNPLDTLTEEQIQAMHSMLLAEAESITGNTIRHPITLKQLQTVLNKYQANEYSIARIHTKDFNFSIDGTAGRIHTNLTNISSDLRQFISIDGQSLIGRDLVSSQPVFLACLLLKMYSGGDMPEDVERYINTCLDGGTNGPDIYQYIMERQGEKDRKKFKTEFYIKILFGEVPEELNGTAKAFATEFPTVWAFICKLKEGNYKQLAISLQKLEARMFVGAAAEVMKHGVEVLTLHDALYVAPQHTALVDTIILSRFMDTYGVTPTLSE